MIVLAILALLLAALPAALTVVNLMALKAPHREVPGSGRLVSILIPARNEAGQIGAAVEAALASRDVPVEVLVMDDGSTDGTPEIVTAIAARDPRLRLLTAPPLPPDWTGKIHACHHLSEAASGTHLLFVDADVRLEPHAAAALAAHAERTGAALVSAVPRQIMGSPGEWLTVPMINFLLVGFLPIPMMRGRREDPSLGAACGQLILFEREAYRATGGHGAIRSFIHDGIQLPRRFRAHGYATDLVAGANLASCRMYRGFTEAWAGFAKNAHEGMATPRGLPVWTALLFGGQVLPAILVLAGLWGDAPLILPLAALVLSLGTRLAITLAARESLWSVPLHPLAVLTALAIQWSALVRIARGVRPGWKGRLYPAA